MVQPFFSVVIPTYNRAPLLKRALESLVDQTYKNFEVIVCDDGSKDNTKETVDLFQGILDIKYIWEENWGGPARPRNNGIKIAKSDWICFLDSDDTCLPEKMENFKKYVADYDVIYHDLIGIDVSKTGGAINPPIFDQLLLRRGNTSLITSSVCIRKSLINAVNGVAENIAAGVEDYDLYLKLANITNRFKHIPLNLGKYHLDHTNIHHNVYNMYKGVMQVLGKYKDHPMAKKAIKERKLHYFPYLAVFNKSEAIRILPSTACFNISFAMGSILLIIPTFISKAAIKFMVKHFFKNYSYLVQQNGHNLPTQ